MKQGSNHTHKDPKRIGIITIFFERGQSYASLNLHQAFSKEHEVFVFARMSGIGRTHMQARYGEFLVPNISYYPSYDIPPEILKQWIKKNDLDAVVLVEEQWQKESLLKAVKEVGVLAIGLPMIEFAPLETAYEDFKDYDVVICPTTFTYQRLESVGLTNLLYVRWGAVLSEFEPPEDLGVIPPVRFFHPAGWGGVRGRKATQEVVWAFEKVKENLDATLLVHMQIEQGHKRGSSEDKKILLEQGNVERSRLMRMYSKGHVSVLPTKWSGIELGLIESQCSGLCTITVDAEPMSDWISPGKTGLLVKVANRKDYPGIALKSAEPDVDHLAELMVWCAEHPSEVSDMRMATLEFAKTSLDWDENQKVLLSAVRDLIGVRK